MGVLSNMVFSELSQPIQDFFRSYGIDEFDKDFHLNGYEIYSWNDDEKFIFHENDKCKVSIVVNLHTTSKGVPYYWFEVTGPHSWYWGRSCAIPLDPMYLRHLFNRVCLKPRKVEFVQGSLFDFL